MLEEHRTSREFGKLIQKLGCKERLNIDLSTLKDSTGTIHTKPEDIHDTLSKSMEKTFCPPVKLDPAAEQMQYDEKHWSEVVDAPTTEDALHSESLIPRELQQALRKASKRRLQKDLVMEMERRLRHPITFEEFRKVVKKLKADKAPGPSLLTVNMVKGWPYETSKAAYIYTT
jgi:hypothetical protein